VQAPGTADHLNRGDVHGIEAVRAGDEPGDLLGWGDQQPGAIRRFDHDVADWAKRRRRPSSDDDAVARGRTEGGDLTVESPA
jgi:hypothetical protein